MSIKTRLKTYTVRRQTEHLNEYGTPHPVYTTLTVEMTIVRNIPAHDAAKPYYVDTKYIGATTSKKLREGDVLERKGKSYIVKDIGERGSYFTAVYLDEY